MTTGNAADFAKRLDQTAEETERLLAELLSDTLLPDEIARPKRLMEAMRYSTLAGGKRIRPLPTMCEIGAQIARLQLRQILCPRLAAQMHAQKAQKRRNITLIRRNRIVRETALLAQMRGPV